MRLTKGFEVPPLTIWGMKMNKKIVRIFYALETLGFLSLVLAQSVYAAAGSEDDLGYFLTQIGDFLIRTIGPGVLVIGVAVAGVSMALGDEQGMRRGALAAGGGALIMLSRAVLDLVQNVTHF